MTDDLTQPQINRRNDCLVGVRYTLLVKPVVGVPTPQNKAVFRFHTRPKDTHKKAPWDGN